MKFWTVVGSLFILLNTFPFAFAEARSSCFSCRIEINSLDEPLSLAGTWLFTRDDRPENAQVNTSEESWVTVPTPGPWNRAYNDGQLIDTGWYRGHFHFAPELIGKKVVFYLDAYMSPMKVFLDGDEIYSRGDTRSYERYYSLQPVPVTFTVTKLEHLVSVRIQTKQMIGIFQLPFQLRPYKAYDPAVSFYRFIGGEIRNIAAYICLFVGLFFLLVYSKTRYSLYLVAAFSGMGLFPYYALPHDNLVQIFEPRILWTLHYTGIPMMVLSHFYFAQYFSKFTPRSNIVHTVVVTALVSFFISQVFTFNHAVFNVIRKFANLYSFAIAAQFMINLTKAMRENKRARIMWLCELTFLVTATHDLLASFGLIQSTNLMPLGTLIGTSGVMYVTSIIFAETFVSNKLLLAEVQEINQNLEKTVAIRTADLSTALGEAEVLSKQLAVQNNAIKAILDNVEFGLLRCNDKGQVLPGYSRSCLELLAPSLTTSGELSGGKLWDLLGLGGRDAENFEVLYLQSVDDDLLAEDLITQLPKRVACGPRSLAVNGAIIRDTQGRIESVLFSLADITKLVEAEQENENNQSLLRILKSRSRFIGLLRQTLEAPTMESSAKTGDFSSTKRNLHTWKGDFSVFGLSLFSGLLHQIEDRVTDLDRVETELADFRKHVKEYLEDNHKVLGIHPDDLDRHVIMLEDKDILSFEQDMNSVINLEEAKARVHRFITYARSEEAQNLLDFLLDGAREQANKQGKQLKVDLKGAHVRFPLVYAEVLGSLVHVFRNAVDHGIEPPHMRRGKSPQGHITVQVNENPVQYMLTIADDGSGISRDAVRKKAVAQGLYTEAQWLILTPEQQLMTIFLPGFSTRQELTETSGRGIGLDAVAEAFQRAGGTIHVQSFDGQGTSFTFTLPKLFSAVQNTHQAA